MSRPLLIVRTQMFTITCNDCGQSHWELSWLAAKRWLPKHRKECDDYQRGGRRKHGRMVECPICHESRYLMNCYIHKSEKRNANHPELIGIHKSCRMRVIKPAKKRA